jgi:putative transposase
MELSAPLATVCTVLDAPRSTIYARRSRTVDDNVIAFRRPGPSGAIDDEQLLALIRQVLDDSPFTGEGYRKVHARLRREHGVRVGRKRVLRLMREHHLLAPQRTRGRRKPRPHDGTIVPDAPDVMWGTDATMAYTTEDGWVWLFAAIDHYTAEAWTHLAARGDRFAALQPVYDAVIDRFGGLEADVARGISLRHDWGPQYRSGHFTGSIRWLGLNDSPAYVGEPETNGCAERFIRTLKEQCLWAKPYATIDELRQSVAEFTHLYNTEWLIERHGHRTPREARADALTSSQAA